MPSSRCAPIAAASAARSARERIEDGAVLAERIAVPGRRGQEQAPRPLELGARSVHLGDAAHGEAVEQRRMEADIEDVELVDVLRLDRRRAW